MRWVSRINETRRLLHVYLFRKSTMEESIIGIKLSNYPVIMKGKCENQANSSRFDHWTKCLIVVKARPLVKALGNKMSLVSRYRSIKVSFDYNTHLQPTMFWDR